MMKTTHVKDPSSNGAVMKRVHCWNKTAQTQSFRVELADGSFYLFPYMQVAFTKFERSDNRERLTVRVPTHNVQITGTNLRELGLAFQKDSVEWVREIPERYMPLVSKDGVRIERIEVKQMQREQ